VHASFSRKVKKFGEKARKKAGYFVEFAGGEKEEL
jgi:hypothetical protein